MRKNYEKDAKCPICGEWFNYLGLASHKAACRRKKQKDDKKPNVDHIAEQNKKEGEHENR